MKTEADFKKAFCKSLRHFKGTSIKLACPTFNGVPDLFVIAQGFMPVLLEAKWFGEIKAHNFNRKIPYTALQVDWINECHKVQPYSALGLIGFKFQGETYCVLVESGTTHMNYGFKACQPWVVLKDGKFDIQDLFTQSQIPMMQLQYKYGLTGQLGLDNMGISTSAARITANER